MSKRWLCNMCDKEVPEEPSNPRYYYGCVGGNEVMLTVQIWRNDSLLTYIDRVCDSCCITILEEGYRGLR